ncbi:hypothetical protein RFUL19S_01245 [Rhizobacter fulvus]
MSVCSKQREAMHEIAQAVSCRAVTDVTVARATPTVAQSASLVALRGRRAGIALLCAAHFATAVAQSSGIPVTVLDDYRNERYDKAISALETLSQRDDNLQAQGLLCEAKMLGRGVEKAGSKFPPICRDAYERGSVVAKSFYAAHLLSVSPVDLGRGRELALEAEREGDARGANVVGNTYFLGLAVAKDLGAAFKHYELGRQRGSATANYVLALYYFNGYGVVNPDNERALAYLNQAVARHSPEAMLLLQARCPSPPASYQCLMCRCDINCSPTHLQS